jgi:MFS family permease
MGVVAAIASVGFGWLFVRTQFASPSPVVDLTLFRQSHYAFACASICLSNLVMYTVLLSLPLFLERVRDHGVQTTGIVLAAMSGFSALLGPMSGRWADKRGYWSPAVWGASALAAGMVVLVAGTMADGLALIVVALVVIGLGLGISGAPVQAAALQAVSADRAGSAAGIFSTARYVGSVAGSTVLALIFAGEISAGDRNAFAWLFVGLTGAALLGIVANSRVADRHQEPAAQVAASVPTISSAAPVSEARSGGRERPFEVKVGQPGSHR